MKKHSLSVTVMSWLFIMSGGNALVAELLPPAQRLAVFTTSATLEQLAEGAA